ncbi:MAG: acyltransferase [Methanoregulaceae archaeon]
MDAAPDGTGLSRRLARIRDLIDEGPDTKGTSEILSLSGCPPVPEDLLPEIAVYAEYLPKSAEFPFSPEQRYLQFLWDAFDRSCLSVATNFAFPFRRMIGKRLFRSCGKNFCAEYQVRFNFGQFLSLGNDVYMNAGVFIDTKGGVSIGDSTGIAEFVKIFTHGHGEANHVDRTYSPVRIGSHVKIYTGATILPGVTIGDRAIVAGGAIVTKDVPPNMVVAGIPANVIRERRNEGRTGNELNHTWLHNGAFQDE